MEKLKAVLKEIVVNSNKDSKAKEIINDIKERKP